MKVALSLDLSVAERRSLEREQGGGLLSPDWAAMRLERGARQSIACPVEDVHEQANALVFAIGQLRAYLRVHRGTDINEPTFHKAVRQLDDLDTEVRKLRSLSAPHSVRECEECEEEYDEHDHDDGVCSDECERARTEGVRDAAYGL